MTERRRVILAHTDELLARALVRYITAKLPDVDVLWAESLETAFYDEPRSYLAVITGWRLRRARGSPIEEGVGAELYAEAVKAGVPVTVVSGGPARPGYRWVPSPDAGELLVEWLKWLKEV